MCVCSKISVLSVLFVQYKGLPIRWGHLHEVYTWDTGMETKNPGLKMLHKIHHEHLHLTPSMRMRVYLAVQVSMFPVLIHSISMHCQ